MKKLIVITIALAMILSLLVACNPTAGGDPSETTPAVTDPETPEGDTTGGGGLEISTDDDTREWGEIIFPAG